MVACAEITIALCRASVVNYKQSLNDAPYFTGTQMCGYGVSLNIFIFMFFCRREAALNWVCKCALVPFVFGLVSRCVVDDKTDTCCTPV